jgi:hypothetical protein
VKALVQKVDSQASAINHLASESNQLKAQMPVIEIGRGLGGYGGGLAGWPLSNGTNARQYPKSFGFTKHFTHPPNVIVGITSIDADHNPNRRMSVYVDNITASGFVMHTSTFGESVIFSVGYSWVAIGE